MTKSRTCAGTRGLVTTEVNFLGIELPPAMCTSYLTGSYVRIVYLIETVDECVWTITRLHIAVDVSTYAARRQTT